MMSYLVTREIAQQAVLLAAPLIVAAMQDSVFKRRDLHIVIMNPGKNPDFHDVSESILYEESFGEPDEWEGPYQAVARSKAALAWKHRMSTRELVTSLPHLLVEGDTIYPGGTWLFGISVGTSGVESEYDEAISNIIACLIRALAINRMRTIMEGKDAFLGAPTT